MYPTVLAAVTAVATISKVAEQLGYFNKETPAEPGKAVEAAERKPADIGFLLSRISRFNGSGYETWSSKMKTMLMYQDLWDLVEGGYTEEELTVEEVEYVRKRDAAPLLLIQLSIDESIFSCIANAKTSKQAWDALEKKYKGKAPEPTLKKVGDELDSSCTVDATKSEEALWDPLYLEKHVNESVLSSHAVCADATGSKGANAKVVETNGASKAFGEFNNFGSKDWCSGNSSSGFCRDDSDTSTADLNGKKCEVFKGYRGNSCRGGRGGRIGGHFDNYQGGSGGREGENINKKGIHGGGPGDGNGLRFNKGGSPGAVDNGHINNNQRVHGGQYDQHSNKQGSGGGVDSEPLKNNPGFHRGGFRGGGQRGGGGHGGVSHRGRGHGDGLHGDGGRFGGFHGGGSDRGGLGSGGRRGGFRGGRGFCGGGGRGGYGSGDRKHLNNNGGGNHKHFKNNGEHGGNKHKSFNEGSREGINDGCFNPKNDHRGVDGQPFIGSQGGHASTHDECFNNEHSVFGEYNSSNPKMESISSCTTDEIKLEEAQNALEQQHKSIDEMPVKPQDGSTSNGMNSTLNHSHEEARDLKCGGRNIFINNLDMAIDDKMFHDFFSAIGNILSCKVVTFGSGVSKGYGYIEYDSEEAAQKAIEKMDGAMFNGKQVRVKYFVSKQERGMGVKKTKLSPTNVFVGNLSQSTTEDDLRNAFHCFGGTISNVVLMRDGDGKSKCYGFVHFKDADDAAWSVEVLNGHKFDDKVWQVRRAFENKFVGKAKMKPVGVPVPSSTDSGTNKPGNPSEKSMESSTKSADESVHSFKADASGLKKKEKLKTHYKTAIYIDNFGVGHFNF
ncbi:unnamed protein product [Cuscuta campestris]|uniref:RRM domain-containing protein n=1 Tax=Cuscuta campestris TaxID=132261 RepID=A0A484KF32_9ASTE|nr:unnamed protein product [Cuscuta campestris]